MSKDINFKMKQGYLSKNCDILTLEHEVLLLILGYPSRRERENMNRGLGGRMEQCRCPPSQAKGKGTVFLHTIHTVFQTVASDLPLIFWLFK